MLSNMQWINTPLLDAVVVSTQKSPRRRKNYNFHPTDDYPGHRLLNAMEPGAYLNLLEVLFGLRAE